MAEFALDQFGKFNNTEILSLRDPAGQFWFTQEVVASALDVDRTTITYIRQNHPGEFTEGIEYNSIVWDGKRRLVYSEEGFLTICDMSTSEVAYRLRRWMRQQFRVKHQGRDIVVQAKALPREDFSDLGPDLVILQQMLSTLAEDRRRIIQLENEQMTITAETQELKEKVAEHEERIAVWEDNAKIKPGEMTAIQLAGHCGWLARSGAPHNTAVILAAMNHGYLDNGLMQTRREQGPGGMVVEVYVFTPTGVAQFISQVDAKYSSGQRFEIKPNDIARVHGNKNMRYVLKQ